jgi:hypothetical protein
MKIEQKGCSETTAHKIEMRGNHPKEKTTLHMFVSSSIYDHKPKQHFHIFSKSNFNHGIDIIIAIHER